MTSNTSVHEIAPDVFRIATFIPPANMTFNQFLVRDREPLLFHTGLRALFPAVRDAVASILPPESIRTFGFSHFEADECGSLNEWLVLAPEARVACTQVSGLVSVADFIGRRVPGIPNGEIFSTGRFRFRFLATPQVPHAWDAGLLFEETQRTLFCSDLFHQGGNPAPVIEDDIVGPARALLQGMEQGIFAHYLPWTTRTHTTFETLAGLQPNTLAAMHGGAYRGDGARALRELRGVIEGLYIPAKP